MKVSDAKAAIIGGAPRILLLDIETTPMLSRHWKVWDENISPEQLIEPSTVLCWAAKWLGKAGMVFERRRGASDRAVVRAAHRLMDRCDVLVAHNGKAFDVKTLQSRFAFHGLPPVGPYRVVDTCLLARAAFNFPHNSLDGLCRYLGIGDKLEHEGFGLWVKCMAGDREAWRRMEAYNCRDVELLEAVYLRLRAFDRRHPNVGLLYEDGLLRCVCCGSTALKKLPRLDYKTAAAYQVHRCQQCGKLIREGRREYHSENAGRNV